MEYSGLLPSARLEHILVVDDSADNLFLIETILESEGYQVSTATHGKAALEQVINAPPDLVLLDVMMPGMNGYEVTRRIRLNKSLPFMPILLITAHDRPKVAEGLDLGADDFIRKPVEYDELLARVRSLLRLKRSVDERDEIARQREDFVSRLAHDLRTPLIAADRMLTLMQEENLGTMQEAAAILQRSNQNLLQMVNMLLEVYRHEAGHKILNLTAVNLPRLIAEVVQELTPLASQKGLDLNLKIEPQPEQWVVKGDPLEMRRVLMNLVGNAITFTEQGEVRVRFYPVELVDPQGVVVEIQDTGPGIAPEDQPYLFQRFRQGSHQRSGSGLGLYLSYRIVTLHGGQLKYQTVPTGGSLFTVFLPVARVGHHNNEKGVGADR